MIVKTIEQAMTDMFLAYGRLQEDRARQYLVVFRDRAPCTTCALQALEDARSAFDRTPTLKNLLGLYWSIHEEHKPVGFVDEPEPYEGPIDAQHSPADDPNEVPA